MSNLVSEVALLAWTQLWQVTFVALVTLLLVRLLGKNRPHLSYVLLLLVVVKSLTPPVWSSPLGVFSWSWKSPSSDIPVTDTHEVLSDAASAQQLLQTNKDGVDASRNQDLPVQREVSVQGRLAQNWKGCVLLIWVSGILILGTYITVVWQKHLKLMRSISKVAHDDLNALCNRVQKKIGLKRKVRLLVCSELCGPSCFGLFLPSIAVPEQLLAKAKSEDIEMVLAHELIHIRRGDTWIAMLQVLAGIVWWYHPLFWLVSREMTRVREKCCDEEVVASTACDPGKYAQGILEVLKLNNPIEPGILTSGIRSVDITKERMELIMRRKANLHPHTPKVCWAALIGMALLVLPGQVSLPSNAYAGNAFEQPITSKEESIAANSATASTPTAAQAQNNKERSKRARELADLLVADDRFQLAENEVLKFVPPDTDFEPLNEYRRLHSDGDRNAWMHFHATDDDLRIKQWTYGDDRSVASVFATVLGLNLQFIKGDIELLDEVLLGDWIFRRDPQKSHIVDPREVAVVEKAIAKEIGGDCRLKLQIVDLPAYEAMGDYEFHPMEKPDGTSYQIRGNVADRADGTFIIPARRTIYTGTVARGFDAFLDIWGEVLLTPIVDEVGRHPENNNFFLTLPRDGTDSLMQRLPEDVEREVISDFTKQTGLTLKKVTRPVQVLVIERGERS